MLRIEVVTKALDIKRGARMDECNCPVARAIRRSLKARGIHLGPGGVRVGESAIGIMHKRLGILRAPVGKRLRRFIHVFDNYEEVDPQTCVLRFVRLAR